MTSAVRKPRSVATASSDVVGDAGYRVALPVYPPCHVDSLSEARQSLRDRVDRQRGCSTHTGAIAYHSVPAQFIAKRASHYHSVLESAIAELLDEGLIQRHVRKMRRVCQQRREVLVAALRRQLGDFIAFRIPSCGTAIWVKTKDAPTMVRWAKASRANGVVFDMGKFSFSPAPAAGARLGFASLTEDELRYAVRRLATAAAKTVPRRLIRNS